MIGDRRLRACSQWFEKDREAFSRYLRSKGIVNSGHADPSLPVDPPMRAAPARNIRYKAIAVGNAQNLLVRFILSNLGQESFGQNHWEDTKSYFGGKCAYCGEAKELHMDHGIPINKTCLGEHRLGNLIPSCKKCNDDKHYADFKEFLEDKIERIVKIEAYMASKGYTPLGDNKHIKMIVEQAHEEVAALARRYVAIINRCWLARPMRRDARAGGSSPLNEFRLHL